jgi:hypothetical protein
MQLNIGPDMRYTVRLSNGRTIRGVRRKALNDALLAATRGISVIGWRAPGNTERVRSGRIARLQEEYEQGLRSL